jgi:HAD superfamily hydrolase (TIGR01549 family)
MKSLILGMGAYDYALEKVGAHPRGPEEIKSFFGRSTDRIFLELLGDKKKAAMAYEYYFEFEAQQMHNIFPHEGIRSLLDVLKENKIKMAIVTGRHSRELMRLVEQSNLQSYFDYFICDNQLNHSKPHPEGVALAVKKLNALAESSYYVGDSVMDMKAARGAGVNGIAALWDEWANEEEMKKEKPTFLAHVPQDIWTWLEDRDKV